jgi:hypothetical protein
MILQSSGAGGGVLAFCGTCYGIGNVVFLLGSDLVNWRFVLRGMALVLGLMAALLVALAILLPRLFPQPPSGPVPPQPAIQAPRGDLPEPPIALQEWARYEDEPSRLAGSGFLFVTSGGIVVGATTAHSLDLGNSAHVLESVAFRIAGRDDPVAVFSVFFGRPGRPRLLGMDLTIDYVLLEPGSGLAEAPVLEADPRGSPQPGERVVLYSGLDGESMFEGSVLAVGDRGAWIVMDGNFEPGLMSGSPVLSKHTGQVVGMALAATVREGNLLLGIHPIGSLVAKAESAASFPSLRDDER